MKIRQRDGTMREVEDDYILRDGEGFVVPIMLMDARRGMIHDGNGGPVGQRPGFLINDDERAAQAVAAAYAEYDEVLSNRWRLGPGQRSSQAGPQAFGAEPQRSFANPRDAVADAYRQYDADISTRWQSQRWQDQPSNPSPSAPQPAPQTYDSAEAARDAVAAAYREYDEVLFNRWRRLW